MRKGDNLALTLFILLLQLVAEDILRKFRENRIDILEVMYNSKPKGVLNTFVGHATDRIDDRLLTLYLLILLSIIGFSIISSCLRDK